MFFGRVLTPKQSFLYSESTVDPSVGDVLTISNLALAPSSKVPTRLLAGTCIGLRETK